MTPLALVPEESLGENIGNARQLAASFVFLNDADRCGDAGIELMQAIERRLKRAAEQLAEDAARAQAVFDAVRAWRPYDEPPRIA